MADVLDIGVPDQVMGLLADDEQLALEGVGVGAAFAAADKDLADHRLDGLDAVAEIAVVDGNLAPAEQLLPFVADRPFDGLGADVDVGFASRQENHADRVIAGVGQLEIHGFRLFLEQPVGQLHQNTGAIAGQRVGADGAAVVQIDENLDSLANDLMAFAVLDIGDEADTAAIMLVLGVVQTLRLRQSDRCGPILLAHCSSHPC